jgi:hypothetical protein
VSQTNLIYKKMSDVMRDIGAISKDQKNQSQGFRFRGIDQFVNALYPALTRHSVFMTPRATQFNQEIKEVTRSNGKTGVDKHVSIMMEYDFFAEDGSKVTVGPIPAEGVDVGDKATNKALSAALKYALIQTFSIPTEDMAEADFDSPVLGTTISSAVNSLATSQVTSVTSVPASSVSSSVVNAIASPALAAVSAQPTLPVEPLKKSSFRKPTQKVEAPAATTTTPDTSDEWS